jgi:hypothetical protein
MPGYNWPHSQDSGLLEAEVSLLGVAGPADDHVIRHFDLEYLGAFCQSASQPDIALTWSRGPQMDDCVRAQMRMPNLTRLQLEKFREGEPEIR